MISTATTFKDIIKHILDKASSGRRFLVFCAGITLLLCVIGKIWYHTEMLSEGALAAIVTGVFSHYFFKSEK